MQQKSQGGPEPLTGVPPSCAGGGRGVAPLPCVCHSSTAEPALGQTRAGVGSVGPRGPERGSTWPGPCSIQVKRSARLCGLLPALPCSLMTSQAPQRERGRALGQHPSFHKPEQIRAAHLLRGRAPCTCLQMTLLLLSSRNRSRDQHWSPSKCSPGLSSPILHPSTRWEAC